jgi:excisionase family DNA binding protein
MTSNQDTPGDKLLLTVDDVCHRLSVSRATICRMMASGELQTVKLGRSVRIPFDRLQELIRSKETKRPPGQAGDRVEAA